MTSPLSMGLPAQTRACLFDLDGVLTETATVHSAAWQQMFDDFLEDRAASGGAPFVPFDRADDYNLYVDGKQRDDGTCAFLASRGITLPLGTAGDPAGSPTVRGLGRRKNDLLLRRLATDGVTVYDDARDYVTQARATGLATAVVSSSANTRAVMKAASLTGLFDEVVDAEVAAADHLAGKPAPDTFLAGARLLGVDPGEAVVFEDAVAGVAAGRAGEFGWVVGVDRVGQGHADSLRSNGADVVVQRLTDLVRSP